MFENNYSNRLIPLIKISFYDTLLAKQMWAETFTPKNVSWFLVF